MNGFCRHCGRPLEDAASFCTSCGRSVQSPSASASASGTVREDVRPSAERLEEVLGAPVPGRGRRVLTIVGGTLGGLALLVILVGVVQHAVYGPKARPSPATSRRSATGTRTRHAPVSRR